MGSILLHNPVVHLYLLFAASLAIVHVWDYLYPAPADRGHPQGELVLGWMPGGAVVLRRRRHPEAHLADGQPESLQRTYRRIGLAPPARATRAGGGQAGRVRIGNCAHEY